MARPTKYGDWDSLAEWRRNLKSDKWKSKFVRKLETLGRAIRDRVKGHIRDQDLEWVPLSDVTVDLKGGSETIYVHTSSYYNKINAKVTPTSGEGMELVVTVSGKHPSGLSMQQLAAILEYGSSTVPARPLWRPTFAELDNLPEMRDLKEIGAAFSFRGD